jgi:hypothetical protein
MKIMLEIPDQTQASQPATKSAPDTPAPAMSPETPEAKSPKAVAEKASVEEHFGQRWETVPWPVLVA